MKREILQLVLASLLSILVTGAGSWFAFGVNRVSRDEMHAYVSDQISRSDVVIKSNTTSIGKIEAQVGKLVDKQHELLTEQRVLVTQIKLLVNKDDEE